MPFCTPVSISHFFFGSPRSLSVVTIKEWFLKGFKALKLSITGSMPAYDRGYVS
jgi:hypothetical protein